MAILNKNRRMSSFRQPVMGRDQLDEKEKPKKETTTHFPTPPKKKKIGRPRKSDRLEVNDKKITVCISSRQAAHWRQAAASEGRALSDFIRRAVEYYIRG